MDFRETVSSVHAEFVHHRGDLWRLVVMIALIVSFDHLSIFLANDLNSNFFLGE